jgi:ABC-type glycerol-3-phosphate transport system permease component
MLNSYPGLIIPAIASATAAFLFRQVFLTMPEELTEAAGVDDAGPMHFFLMQRPFVKGLVETEKRPPDAALC